MTIEHDHVAEEIICTCTGTTRGDIETLFKQGFDLDGIASKRGVLSGCGGCEWDVGTFLDELSQQQKNNSL